MVAIDTDVFVLAFAFHHDARQAVNAAFLQTVRQNEPAVPIFVVMELLGQLSFNLSASHLAEWRLWLQDEPPPTPAHGGGWPKPVRACAHDGTLHPSTAITRSFERSRLDVSSAMRRPPA